jgi:hypothetical protein
MQAKVQRDGKKALVPAPLSTVVTSFFVMNVDGFWLLAPAY